jgi:hypothetical protein
LGVRSPQLKIAMITGWNIYPPPLPLPAPLSSLTTKKL